MTEEHSHWKIYAFSFSAFRRKAQPHSNHDIDFFLLPALVDSTRSNTCWLDSFKQATDNSSFSLRSPNGRCNIIEPCIRFSAKKLHSQSWCSASKPQPTQVYNWQELLDRTQVLELRCCPLVLASSIKEQRHLTIWSIGFNTVHVLSIQFRNWAILHWWI